MPANEPKPTGEIVLYQSEDGRTRIECRFANENIWLTQRLLADLYQIGVNTINHHIKEIVGDRELTAEATIRQYRIVQTEGARQAKRALRFYNLATILPEGELVKGITIKDYLIVRQKGGRQRCLSVYNKIS